MKIKDMDIEQRREYGNYIAKKNYHEKDSMNNKQRTRARMYQRSKKGFNKNTKFETTNTLQIMVHHANRRRFDLTQSYIREEINEPDVLRDLSLLEEFLAKQITKPEPFIVQLGDIVCEISRYILNRLKDGTHSLRVIVYSKTKDELVLGSNSLLVKQLVSL